MEINNFLTVEDALRASSIWRVAIALLPELEQVHKKELKGDYKLSTVRGLFIIAWEIVRDAIDVGYPGLSKYSLLPEIIRSSPTCIGAMLDNDWIYQLTIAGKLSYTGIVRITKKHGVWAGE